MEPNDRPPKYDGCFGMMSWTWRTFLRKPFPVESCFNEHATHYEKGGCKLRRRWSDLKLRACVAQKTVPMARMMYWAVRACGHPFSPFKSRWGFGGHYTILYPKPTKTERLWLAAEIKLLKKEWQELLKIYKNN